MTSSTVIEEGQKSSIVTAIETQGRVISAIILRETKSRYGEHRLGFLWVLIEPILFIVGFTAFRQILGSATPHGMASEAYMLTGIAPYLLFRETMSSVTGAIGANKSLLGFPQVTTFDLIFARALLELGTIIAVFAVLTTALYFMGLDIDIERPIPLLGSFLLMFCAGVGIGSILCTISPFYPSIKQVSAQLLGRPLFFTSGIFFTADSLPPMVREILLYNPLLHLTEWTRSAFFKSFESQYMDLEYASLFCLALLVVGLMVHKALHKKVLGL